MSEKKQNNLFNSISSPITTLRIRDRSENLDLDNELFKLQNEIWKNVHRILNLKSPV